MDKSCIILSKSTNIVGKFKIHEIIEGWERREAGFGFVRTNSEGFGVREVFVPEA